MSEFLSLRTWPLVSKLSVVGGPQTGAAVGRAVDQHAHWRRTPRRAGRVGKPGSCRGRAVGRKLTHGSEARTNRLPPVQSGRPGHQHLGPGPTAVLAVAGNVAARAAVGPAVLLPARDQVPGIGRIGVDPGLDLGVGIIGTRGACGLAYRLLPSTSSAPHPANGLARG